MDDKMTMTQGALRESGRGKNRMVYFKPDIEERALKLCKEENLSMSLLVRMALVELLEKRGY